MERPKIGVWVRLNSEGIQSRDNSSLSWKTYPKNSNHVVQVVKWIHSHNVIVRLPDGSVEEISCRWLEQINGLEIAIMKAKS